MKKSLKIIIIIFLLIVVGFQQLHVINMKKEIGSYVYNDVDNLYSDVTYIKNKLYNNDERLNEKTIDLFYYKMNNHGIKMISILNYTQLICKDISKLNEKMTEKEYSTLRKSLLNKLTTLYNALEMIKEDCKDDNIKYYKLIYEDNNSTYKKLTDILDFHKM
ncbi:hypothetical protein [Sporosalibacterium faouarense]|uniref:hypothetical protein n=1 Tax=Sporosalibacterium faouarense TaxID=516123 RepID=UPI00192B8E66|nr:hypothetical protein [Sporosalibacterium faouarense]